MEWLFRSEFDPLVTIALWSIAAAAATTIVLFVYTLSLRLITLAANRRRRRLVAEWRDVFAAAMLSAEDAKKLPLPPLRKHDHFDLLEEWNRACTIVGGAAVTNLILLARRTQIPELATAMLGRHRIRSRVLAVQTLGHLRSTAHETTVRRLIFHENTALSITAAAALVDINPDASMDVIIPQITSRTDWPKNRVSIMLREAGSERVSEPLYRAIRSANETGQIYLMTFARLMEPEVLDAMVCDLIRSSNHPGVLNAALKLVSGYSGVPRIAWLAHHDTWFVRMQAASVLGRVGQREHLSLLESLLDDGEWWVRYRAAQAIARLPFMGPNELRRVRRRQSDPFAADILQQAFAEVGLA